jgi:hypothetical protein
MVSRSLQAKRWLARVWFDLLRPRFGWALAILFRYLPVPSSVLGPPKDVIWDAKDFVIRAEQTARREGRGGSHWVLPVRASEVIDFEGALPEHPAFSPRMIHKFAEISVTHLSRGRLALAEGVVISPDDRVFDEFTHNWGESIWRHPVFRRAKMPALRRQPGIFATIVTPGAPRNYCHWLWDALPRIAALEQSGVKDFRLITSHRMRPWQADSLLALGYSAERYVEFGDEYWEMDSLLVPSFVQETGYCRPWAVQWLRNRLLPAEQKKTPGRRIYLDRRWAPRRRLLNEEEVMAALQKEGFEEVAAERLTFSEQVALFASAEIIVAPHGAGLANLLFAPDGTQVIELFSPRYVNPCFFSMTLVRHQKYSCIIGKTDATGLTTDWVTMAEDFMVRPEDVLKALTQSKND